MDSIFGSLLGSLWGFILGLSAIVYVFGGLLGIVVLIGRWRVFEKAGKPGWAVFIPVYSTILLLEIVGRPAWWLILALIPGPSLIVGIMVSLELATAFGKDVGFGIGLILLPMVYWPILGLGDARYVGPGRSAGYEGGVRPIGEGYPPGPGQVGPERYREVEPPLPHKPAKPKVQAWLVDDRSGRSFQLNRGTTSIGRAQDNDICLSNRRVSGHHAKIAEENGHFYLSDLSSTNGTRVNGKFIRKTVLLHSDDTIHFGDQVVVRFAGMK